MTICPRKHKKDPITSLHKIKANLPHWTEFEILRNGASCEGSFHIAHAKLRKATLYHIIIIIIEIVCENLKRLFTYWQTQGPSICLPPILSPVDHEEWRRHLQLVIKKSKSNFIFYNRSSVRCNTRTIQTIIQYTFH